METLTCQPPSPPQCWHCHEGGTHLPSGGLTNETQEQRDAGPHGGPLPGSGGDEMQHLRDGKGTLPFPSLPPATPQGGDGPHAHPLKGPLPTLPPTGVCLPPSHLVSLRADSSRCLLRSARPSLSLCYLYPPTSLSFHLPATLPVHAPAVHMSCCPPVSLLLSVCPRPAADTAFNSLCPSPCCFSGLREGARKSWGGAPSNPGKTLLG